MWIASFIVPDADPQSAYLKEKIRDTVAQFEGYYDVRDGDFYQPCTTDPYDSTNEQSKWCFGRNVSAQGRPMHMKSTPHRSTVDGVPSNMDSRTSGWMTQYVRMAFFLSCHGEGLGCGIARYHAEGIRLATTTPGANPSQLASYLQAATLPASTTLTANIVWTDLILPVENAAACVEPYPIVMQIGGTGNAGEWIWVIGAEGNNLIVGPNRRGGRGYFGSMPSNHSAGTSIRCPRQFTDWAELTAFENNTQAVMIPSDVNMGDMGYYTLVCAAARWSEDFSRSGRASEIWNANCRDTGGDGDLSMYSNYSDPRWLFEAYRAIDRVRVTVSAGTATLRYVAPSGAACRVHVGASAPATSDDSADPVDAPNGRLHTFTASGLSAGTHHYRVSCGPVRASGTFLVQ
jgi:hypothetical protein